MSKSDRIASVRVVKYLFSLWRIAPLPLFGMFILQITFAVLTTTIAPIFVSQLLTHIADGTATLDSSTNLLIGYALVLVVGDIIIVRSTIALSFFGVSKIQAHNARKVLDHLSQKSLGYHSNRMSGGTVSDNTKLHGSIERFWDTIMFTAVPIVTTIVSVSIALSFIFWQYAVAIALLSILVIIVVIRAQTSIAPVSRNVSEKSSITTGYFADVISNLSAVKAFANEEYELKIYEQKIKDWRKAIFKEMRSVLVITGSFSVLMVTLNIVAFATAVLATQYHIATIGVVYLVISYTLNVVAQLWSVAGVTRTYIRTIGDAGPMISALEEPIDLIDNANAEKLAIKDGEITFDHISFTHDENQDALFDDFSLTIKAGEKIGLVGESGSGKTSLTRLLLRFSDVEKGHILIDGQPIDAVTQEDLHKAVAYVSQEPLLFHRTLRENISYGKLNAKHSDVKKAAALSHSLEFIEKLPKGFDTLVGERGVKLSGGQRQRVAIARAILKDAPILVLDEATSALDSHSEKLIQDALTELMKGRTSIVIAHRLSTIAKLDRIIVLDNGKIIEDGSHSELIALKGTYASLWVHQSGGFIEE